MQDNFILHVFYWKYNESKIDLKEYYSKTIDYFEKVSYLNLINKDSYELDLGIVIKYKYLNRY